MRLVVIGGSDAGISAALRARELDPGADVTVVVADPYPNYSICGIPYYLSGEVADWRDLAHRTLDDLQATGMKLRLDTRARRIDADEHCVLLATADGGEESIGYDALVIATGAVPVTTVDRELGALVRAELGRHDVTVSCSTGVDAITTTPDGSLARLEAQATGPDGRPLRFLADLVLVVVGVRPESELAAAAGAQLGVKQAIGVDRQVRTSLRDVFAAGDCAVTHHRLLGPSYLPLGTTAHKQGRIAGENALGASRQFAGSLGTQVVKVFDLVAARSGLRDHEVRAAGPEPLTGR